MLKPLAQFCYCSARHNGLVSRQLALKFESTFLKRPGALVDIQGCVFRFLSLGLVFGLGLGWLVFSGCQTTQVSGGVPTSQLVEREQLVIHSEFHVPRRHRLLDELVARRSDISRLLGLPTSDEPIHIYLFDNESHFRSFVRRRHPTFPDRRALFVKDDTSLRVYAYWGARIAEDLRHEVTHGYLHSVVPNLPLWLDEGTAEYFEVPRGKKGFNSPHIYLLANKLRRGEWTPDLRRLENMQQAQSMTQLDYAESWLWVHFLLDDNPQTRQLFQRYFLELYESANAEPMWPKIDELIPDIDARVVDHLGKLAEQL